MSSAAASGEQEADWRSSIGSFASRARAAIFNQSDSESLNVPLAPSAVESESTARDVELGDRLTSWAKNAQQGLAQSFEHARTVDWSQQVAGVRNSVSNGLERASSTASTASSNLQNHVTHGIERAKTVDWSEHASSLKRGASRGLETVASTASSSASSMQERISESNIAQQAREGVSSATGTARGALSVASERVSGAASLAMDPCRLWKFIAMFTSGTVLVLFSLNFLPALLIAPATFSLLFTSGSIVMLGSFVYLSGPGAFLQQISQRKKLPYSAAYIIGLVGTLWATFVRHSFIFTAIFALIQVVSLLYFIASHFPGGTSGLSVMGRFAGRSARSLVGV